MLFLGKEAVIEAAAVAHAVAQGVKEQTGHEHQSGFVHGFFAVFRFGDTLIAVGNGTCAVQPQELHFAIFHLGHGDTLAVCHSTANDGLGAYLLIVAQVGVNALGFLIGGVLHKLFQESLGGKLHFFLRQALFPCGNGLAQSGFVHRLRRPLLQAFHKFLFAQLADGRFFGYTVCPQDGLFPQENRQQYKCAKAEQAD